MNAPLKCIELLSLAQQRAAQRKKNEQRMCERPLNVVVGYYLLLLHLLNGLLSRTTWVSRYQKGKTSLDLNEARDDGVLGCSGISWTICKQSAPCSRQITTPATHHSIFTGRMLFPTPNQQCQSTDGRLLRQIISFVQIKI